MASPSVKALSFIFFFFLLSSVSASEDQTQNKVHLGLYYESLCPYSANFIVNYLVKVIGEDELFSIVDLHLSPWGNAKIRKSDNETISFDCQHGPSECLLNTVEACAIDIWPDVVDHFPFIYCVESLAYEHKWPEWETCFDKLGLDSKPVKECYTGGYGKQLELQYAKETISLHPPHKYVPWVVVNGQPLYEEYEDVISYICKAYKGSTVPKACSSISLNTIHSKKSYQSGHVSYKDSALSARFRSVFSWIHKMNWPAIMFHY